VTGSAAGRVLLNGADRGSGFAIAGSLAVTAGHVVWSEKVPGGGRRPGAWPSDAAVVYLVDRGAPATVAAVVVEYQPTGGEPIPVTRVEVSTGLDVAVLHLQRPAPAVLPAAGQVTAGQQWRVDTRPDPGAPVLRGTVTEPQRPLKNAAGKETTLIQLWVEQEIGSYRGYSGSPVLAQAAGGVLGVLVEQAFWRVAAQLGAERPVANVLFAAPIDQVVAEFDLSGVPVARSVRDIPLPVSFEVERPGQLHQVIGALTGASPDEQLVGLVGMGGSGKSVLAAAAARDPKVTGAFPDGRFWLELGPDPPLLQLQASLAAVLGDSRPITDVPNGRARLSRLLAERRCLLVLDNVWDQAHVPAFNVMGPSGRVLVTTRDAATVPGATVIPIGELNPEASMHLLAGWAATMPGELPLEAEQVARECGYLPLALAVCGALINAGSHDWPQLLGLLRGADLDALPIRLEDYPHPSLAVALGASIDTLPLDARDRYLRLAAFSGQGAVPAAAVQVLWGLDQEHTSALVEEFAAKSLLHVEAGRVSLHDLQMDYLTRRAPGLPALHDRLLAAYRDQCPAGWATGPDDGYFYQHLAHHLHQAGRIADLRALLLDLDWMNAKLTAGTISGLLADYETLPSDPALHLVADALRLSAHVLADHPGQLLGQLTGRLVGQNDPQLRDLLQRARRRRATPWLRPLTASLTPPGGPLLRTLTGHDGSVNAVAVSADGRRAVSGGYDKTVRVWDLDAGALLHTLTGHDGSVDAVAVTADGRHVVTFDQWGTVRVWDLGTGEPLHILADRSESAARAVTVSADGRRAVTLEYGGTVRVWDLNTGELLHTLTDRSISRPVSAAKAVAVSADGRRVVTGGWWGGTVQVLDLDTGKPQRTLVGHGGSVNAVAVSADNRRVVSGGWDGTVRVWELDSEGPSRVLAGHDGSVNGVAVSADNRRVVSGGSDGTVRVWELDSEGPSRVLAGHDGSVSGVAVSADGNRAVSGGSDGTVRVWDLVTGTPQRTLTGHNGSVSAVAVSADGNRAVSGSRDGTVQVWDLATGKWVVSGGQRLRCWFIQLRCWFLRRFRHTDCDVLGLSVSADGRRAVSGGSDGTVRMWDMDTGALRYTRTGQRYDLNVDVAVSADGRRAVSGVGAGMRVWDMDTGALLHTLTGTGHYVRVAVSADGRHAVSGGGDRTVRVWDLAQRAELASFVSDNEITALAATTPGTRVIAGTSGGSVHLLKLRGYE